MAGTKLFTVVGGKIIELNWATISQWTERITVDEGLM